MNDDRVQSRHQYLRSAANARWMKRSDDDLRASANHNVDYLADKLHERYSIAKNDPKTQINIVDVGNADLVKQASSLPHLKTLRRPWNSSRR